MLEQLFGSRTRTKILHLFLENRDASFFVREICRLINERIHSVRRELENLEKFGLIVFNSENQKKYYKINLSFPLVGELQNLFDKSRVLIERVVGQKAMALDGVKYVALTGQFTKENDVQTDVLIIGRLNREALEKFVKEVERQFGRSVRYTYFTTQEFNLRKDLADKFLYSIFNSKKIVLVNRINF